MTAWNVAGALVTECQHLELVAPRRRQKSGLEPVLISDQNLVIARHQVQTCEHSSALASFKSVQDICQKGICDAQICDSGHDSP